MAYNKFKRLEQLQTDLGINDFQTAWLGKFSNFASSQKILDDLAEASRETLTTEKAKSEFVVVPILKELRRHNPDKFKIFSGFEFNVDSKLKLLGFCDFMLSMNVEKMELTAPIFCLLEAKNAEIEKGFAQCGAEMYAAQLFNERKGQPQKVIYGCVTNAFSWCFMKLEGKNLYIDTNFVPLNLAAPNNVLAVLQWILDVSIANK